MRALIVGDNRENIAKVRNILHRSGFDDHAMDEVSLDGAAESAGQARRDFVVLLLSPDGPRNLLVLREIRSIASAAILAIGPANDPKFILSALHEGADEYLDQAELETELRSTLVRLKSKRMPEDAGGPIIGVLAASGGSGASTLAANLATALAERHRRTALFDLCLAAGDQSVLFDLKPTHTIADLCRHCERMDQSMFQQSLASHRSGVSLLAAPSKRSDITEVTPQGVRRALGIARASFPYVVMDLDRAMGPEQRVAVVQADVVLLVVRLDMISLRNTRRMLDQIHEMGIADSRIRLVVNRHRQPKELPPGKAEQALGINVLQFVPNDVASVNLASHRGIPVVLERPRSKMARSIRSLAESLANLHRHHLHNGHLQNGSPEGTLLPPDQPLGEVGDHAHFARFRVPQDPPTKDMLPDGMVSQ